MKRLLFPALLCAGGAAAWALFGVNDRPVAALWLPAESFSDWQSVHAALSSHVGLKFTLGVTPDMLTQQAKGWLTPWVERGRLELALRLPGDPLLPMIASNPLESLALARERHRKIVGALPAGFVPAAGAPTPILLGSAKALGFSWVAAGVYAGSTAAWSSVAGAVLVPFSTHSDADGLVIEEGGVEQLSDYQASSSRAWTTVADLIANFPRPIQASPAQRDWSNWTGGFAAWTAGAAAAAWKLYGDAAAAVEHFKNSGGASVKSLEDASEALGRAEANRNFRQLNANDPNESAAADERLRGALKDVYKKIAQPAPALLSIPLLASATQPLEAGALSEVKITQGPGTLDFDNPRSAVVDSTFALRGLRVNWDEKGISLTWRMESLEGGAALLLDAYLDLNHVLAAGSSSMLDGRAAFVQARDAWEYAVAATASGATLYRSNPAGAPLLISRFPVSIDASAAEISVAIPASYLRGNPARWGYVAAAMALDPSTSNAEFAKPLPGTNLRGILASLDAQKEFAANRDVSKARLAAVRADR